MNLRERLRVGTRRSQDALEAAFGRFDLTRPEGLRAFLAAHLDAVAALRAQDDGALGPALDAASERLSADLGDLAPRPCIVPADDDPLARAWLWHGTRLPTRMIARRAEASSAYLDAPRDTAAWRALCDNLEAADGYGTAADRVLGATYDWYAAFETACLDRARR